MVDSHQACHLRHLLLVACFYSPARFVLHVPAMIATEPLPAPGRYELRASSCSLFSPQRTGEAVYTAPVGLIVEATFAVAQTVSLVVYSSLSIAQKLKTWSIVGVIQEKVVYHSQKSRTGRVRNCYSVAYRHQIDDGMRARRVQGGRISESSPLPLPVLALPHHLRCGLPLYGSPQRGFCQTWGPPYRAPTKTHSAS